MKGYLAYGLSLEKSKLHGINFNQINATFLKSFNSNAGRWLITYSTLEDEIWLQLSQVKKIIDFFFFRLIGLLTL
jgi:hypothetical protein